MQTEHADSPGGPYRRPLASPLWTSYACHERRLVMRKTSLAVPAPGWWRPRTEHPSSLRALSACCERDVLNPVPGVFVSLLLGSLAKAWMESSCSGLPESIFADVSCRGPRSASECTPASGPPRGRHSGGPSPAVVGRWPPTSYEPRRRNARSEASLHKSCTRLHR